MLPVWEVTESMRPLILDRLQAEKNRESINAWLVLYNSDFPRNAHVGVAPPVVSCEGASQFETAMAQMNHCFRVLGIEASYRKILLTNYSKTELANGKLPKLLAAIHAAVTEILDVFCGSQV